MGIDCGAERNSFSCFLSRRSLMKGKMGSCAWFIGLSTDVSADQTRLKDKCIVDSISATYLLSAGMISFLSLCPFGSMCRIAKPLFPNQTHAFLT